MVQLYHRLTQTILAFGLSLGAFALLRIDPNQALFNTAVRPYARTAPELTQRLVASLCSGMDSKLQTALVGAVQDASERYEIEPHLLLAIMLRESSCRPHASSNKGAQGLMQLMPGTAKALGVDNPFALRENIFGGAKYVAILLRQFDGKLYLALAAYNAGPSAVRKYGNVPPYPETLNYVRGVLKNYNRLSREVTI